MEYSLATLALTDINLDDHSYRITTIRDKPALLKSIATIGLLTPPALRYNDSGWIIVSGFRRIEACRQAGLKTIVARRIAEDQPRLDCFRLAVIENNAQRPLNLIETARAVRHLRSLCGPTPSFADELARLGLPTSRAMIDKLERLIGLSGDLQDAVRDGNIGLDVALSIGALGPADQSAVQAIFTQIKMSVSKQREIMALARDIAGRDRISVSAVLQSDPIRSIVENHEVDRNVRVARLRRQLKQTRYPHLSEAEAHYQRTVGLLKLGPHMRIEPPEGFEGLTYTLTLRFKTCRDLHAARRKLGAALQNPLIESIFPH